MGAEENMRTKRVTVDFSLLSVPWVSESTLQPSISLQVKLPPHSPPPLTGVSHLGVLVCACAESFLYQMILRLGLLGASSVCCVIIFVLINSQKSVFTQFPLRAVFIGDV